MPDNLVNIVFQADTSQMTQAFAKLDAELASSSVGATAAMGGFGKQTAIADSTLISFGKSSARFGSLSAVMQAQILGASGSTKSLATETKSATRATEEASKSVGKLGDEAEHASGRARGLTSELRAMRFDVFLVVAAIGAAVKAFQEFATEESADRQLKGILGSSKEAAKAMDDLAKSADSENFKASEYDDIAKSLKVAGIQTKDLDADVSALGEASRSSNIPLATLAKQLIDVQEHSTGSMADMMVITEATQGATQGLTNQYRDLAFNLEMATRALAINSEQQAWSFKKTSEQISATQSLANKKTLQGSGGPISPADKAFADFQANIYGGQQNYAFEGGSWAQTRLLKAEQQKLKEGYAQMKKEYEPSIFGETQGMVQSGMWSKEDLLAAADRARGQKQEVVTRDVGLQKRDMGYAAEDKQRALYKEAVNDLIAQTGELAKTRHKAAEDEKKSAQGKLEAAALLLSKAAAAVGKKEAGIFNDLSIPKELEQTQTLPSIDVKQFKSEDIEIRKALGISAPTSQIKEPDLTGLSAGLKSGAPASEKTVLSLQKRIAEGYAPKMIPLGPSSGHLDLTTTTTEADLARIRPSAEMIARATPTRGTFLPAGSGLSFFPGSRGPGGGGGMGSLGSQQEGAAMQAVRDQTPSGIAANYDWSIPFGGAGTPPGAGKPAGAGSSGPAHVADPTMHELMGRLLQMFSEGG